MFGCRWAALVLALVLGLGWPSTAHADVVSPPPPDCPPERIPAPSHGLRLCLDPAPEDCPAGWIGRLGGACVVDVCTGHSDCGIGKTCRPHSLCYRRWVSDTDFNHRTGEEIPLDEPRVTWRLINVCGYENSCNEGRCLPAKVCLPPSATRAGFIPASEAGSLYVSTAPVHGCGAGCSSRTHRRYGLGTLAIALAVLGLRHRSQRG